jgi:hypothetical protein
MPAADKRTAIVDPHGDATVVTDLDQRAERQGAMRRRHRRAIESLAARRARSAKPVASAIDAGDFGMRYAADAKTQRRRNKRDRQLTLRRKAALRKQIRKNGARRETAFHHRIPCRPQPTRETCHLKFDVNVENTWLIFNKKDVHLTGFDCRF